MMILIKNFDNDELQHLLKASFEKMSPERMLGLALFGLVNPSEKTTKDHHHQDHGRTTRNTIGILGRRRSATSGN